MSTDDTYNGRANRETWAFMLHVSNDQGLQQDAYNAAGETLAFDPEQSDHSVGEAVVTLFRDLIFEWTDEYGETLPENLRMFRDEVGSWWRVNRAEIGKHFREELESQA